MRTHFTNADRAMQVYVASEIPEIHRLSESREAAMVQVDKLSYIPATQTPLISSFRRIRFLPSTAELRKSARAQRASKRSIASSWQLGPRVITREIKM